MPSGSPWRSAAVGVSMGLVALLLILTGPGTSWAPPLIRIGVVNWEETVMRYRDFQSDLEELERRRTRILRFIEEEYGELQREKIERKDGAPPRDPELKKLYEDAFAQVRNQRQNAIKRHHQRILRAIRREAVEQGYSLILSENEVLYAAESYTDLTGDVIARLNEGSQPAPGDGEGT